MISELHKIFNEQTRFTFPFQQRENQIPMNGIYVIFENGEYFDNMDRIVLVGTHTGDNQLCSRLNQHFVNENKNRSIFRKNIGRCLLNKENSSYLSSWEHDTTSTADKEKYLNLLDLDLEKQLEKRISDYLQTNLSFCVFQIDGKKQRLFWKSKIISTLAKSTELKPSKNWLGNHSTKDKIKAIGLWQENGLFNESLTEKELDELKNCVMEKSPKYP